VTRGGLQGCRLEDGAPLINRRCEIRIPRFAAPTVS